jgi:hypothetical protein
MEIEISFPPSQMPIKLMFPFKMHALLAEAQTWKT